MHDQVNKQIFCAYVLLYFVLNVVGPDKNINFVTINARGIAGQSIVIKHGCHKLS
ncbi:MAG TPA: hypothetical protein PKM56_01855 [Candidatus Rifleibacterium sp.]|nr:hypothetical protein [Candidatus Rifleibacterium sp.]